MSNITTYHLSAGLLIRKQIRQALDGLIFEGAELTYHENKGWLDSVFILKGDKLVLEFISKKVEEHFGETQGG